MHQNTSAPQMALGWEPFQIDGKYQVEMDDSPDFVNPPWAWKLTDLNLTNIFILFSVSEQI